MRIGELAKKTGVAARMLRYYEEQGLMSPRRLDNGYVMYDDYLVERVEMIRGLVDSGVPTRIISDILPCLSQPQTTVVQTVEPGLRELLVTERDHMTERIDSLSQTRESLTRHIEAIDRAATQDQ
jgi:DNA-binding transcriptional MerR regulator